MVDVDHLQLSRLEVGTWITVADFRVVIVHAVAYIAVIGAHRPADTQEDIAGDLRVQPAVVELLVLSFVKAEELVLVEGDVEVGRPLQRTSQPVGRELELHTLVLQRACIFPCVAESGCGRDVHLQKHIVDTLVIEVGGQLQAVLPYGKVEPEVELFLTLPFEVVIGDVGGITADFDGIAVKDGLVVAQL